MREICLLRGMALSVNQVKAAQGVALRMCPQPLGHTSEIAFRSGKVSRIEFVLFGGIAGVALALLGCGGPVEGGYLSVAEIDRPGDSAIIAATAVPRDATDIRVQSSVEAGLYYVSYVTSDNIYSVHDLKLSRVGGDAHQVSRDSIGFEVSLPANADIYFRCRRLDAAVDVSESDGYEVILLANANGRQFQWNQLHDHDLAGKLCAG